MVKLKNNMEDDFCNKHSNTKKNQVLPQIGIFFSFKVAKKATTAQFTFPTSDLFYSKLKLIGNLKNLY